MIAFDAIVLFMSLVKTLDLWSGATRSTKVTTVLIRESMDEQTMVFAMWHARY